MAEHAAKEAGDEAADAGLGRPEGRRGGREQAAAQPPPLRRSAPSPAPPPPARSAPAPTAAALPQASPPALLPQAARRDRRSQRGRRRKRCLSRAAAPPPATAAGGSPLSLLAPFPAAPGLYFYFLAPPAACGASPSRGEAARHPKWRPTQLNPIVPQQRCLPAPTRPVPSHPRLGIPQPHPSPRGRSPNRRGPRPPPRGGGEALERFPPRALAPRLLSPLERRRGGGCVCRGLTPPPLLPPPPR